MSLGHGSLKKCENVVVNMMGIKAVEDNNHTTEGLADQVKAFILHPKSNGKSLKSFKQGNDMIRIYFKGRSH